MSQLTIPQFTEPTEPDLAPILKLHRADDGVVTFHRRNDLGQFENVGAVRRSDLTESLFDQVSPMLDQDAYFSVNAFYRTGHGRSAVCPQMNNVTRRARDLRYLNACYVDIDCHNLGISVGQAIGAIIDMQDRGVIPPASMMTRSGRGVWAYWFLVDAETNSNTPPRWWPESNVTYNRLQRRFHDLTAMIGADAKARDTVRVSRIPGSVNGKAGVRVSYWLQADADGNSFTYTLEGLCAQLDVTPGNLGLTVKKAVDPRYRELGRRGHLALAEKRTRQLLVLAGMRNGFHQGHRNHALVLYAKFLNTLKEKLHADDDEIERNVMHLAAGLKPQLTDKEIRDALTGWKTITRITDQTIADWLDITPEESAQLEGWPPASRFGGKPVQLEPQTRQDRMLQRRGAIRDIVGTATAPPLRDLKERLDEFGITATIRTISNDLDALRIPRDTRPRDNSTPDPPRLFKA